MAFLCCLPFILFFTALVAAVPVSQASTASATSLAADIMGIIDYAVWSAEDTWNNCDLTQARMPIAPTPLPSPSAGLTLSHIAVGRGTQNYTCASGNSTSAPSAVGALASLFNVSCLVVDFPQIAANLTEIALDLPLPFGPAADQAAQRLPGYSGLHYFLDTTTPLFNLDTNQHAYGTGAFKKAAASAAPAGSLAGPAGQGNGAVPWLKLTPDPGYTGQQSLKEVYRVRTAGGSPPATCVGQAAQFQVPYSAQYWFYS